MKNLHLKKYYILMIYICILSASCSDFLEKYPKDQLGSETFWVTENDAVNSINAAYSPLQDEGLYGRDAARWGAKTEEMYRAGDYYNYDLYLPSSSQSNKGYVSAFRGILLANMNLEYIPGMNINSELKDRIIGEAYFLRAFYYNHLARWYGDMPIITELVTSSTNLEMPREPVEDVYQQIIEDLNEAIEKLPEKNTLTGSDMGRATKGAAKTMLADLYLFLAALDNMNISYYQKVKDLCLSVIESKQYSLETEYSDVWDISTENGKESIFEVQFASGLSGEGHQVGQMVTAYNSTTVQDEFYYTWNPDDKRRAESVILPGETYVDYTNNSEFIHQKKLVTGRVNAAGPGGGSGYNSPRNFIVQRYANVLLMYAEAMNEINSTPPQDAVGYVNQIRNRAGLSALAEEVSIDKIAFREAIRTERKYELGFEGFRWLDLIRYEKMNLGGGISNILMDPTSPYYNSTLKLPQHYVFPIPQSELDVNRNPLFTQNPGY